MHFRVREPKMQGESEIFAQCHKITIGTINDKLKRFFQGAGDRRTIRVQVVCKAVLDDRAGARRDGNYWGA